jgi:hypothetical protein
MQIQAVYARVLAERLHSLLDRFSQQLCWHAGCWEPRLVCGNYNNSSSTLLLTVVYTKEHAALAASARLNAAVIVRERLLWRRLRAEVFSVVVTNGATTWIVIIAGDRCASLAGAARQPLTAPRRFSELVHCMRTEFL